MGEPASWSRYDTELVLGPIGPILGDDWAGNDHQEAPIQLLEVETMIGFSLLVAMLLTVLMGPAALGWFAGSSAVAGLAVAAWLSRRAGVQQLFVKGEEPPVTKNGAE